MVNASQQHKSPRYPSISLRRAVAISQAVINGAGRGPIPRQAALEATDLSHSGSTGKRALASLLSYGLWEKSGAGKMRLAERGRLIAADPNLTTEKARAEMRQAAVAPRMHRWAYDQWKEGLPTDDGAMATIVNMELNFNPNVTSRFIRQIRDTFDFAGVYNGARIPAAGQTEEEEDGDDEQGGDEEHPHRDEIKPAASGTPKPPQLPQKPAQPKARIGDTMELTSFPLSGGGRLVLEVPIPTPRQQFQRLLAITETINRELSEYLAKEEGEEPEAGHDAAP